MGNCLTHKEPEKNSKFIGTVSEYGNIQVTLTRLYKHLTGNNLVQERLRTERDVLDVLERLEKQVFGAVQSGSNIPDRVKHLDAHGWIGDT